MPMEHTTHPRPPRLLLAAVVLMLAPVTGCIGGSGKTAEPYDDLHMESGVWSTYAATGKPEPDVFIQKSGSAEVWRPTPNDLADPAMRSAQLFTSARTQAHDPSFGVVGPFPKGAPMGVTLAQWAAARGSWAYACRAETDGPGVFQARLNGLMPQGLYSMWLERIRLNQGDVEASTWTPLGLPDGTRNGFWTDASGGASVRVTLPACLPATELSTQGSGTATQIVVIYHSDGATYGVFPGAFGKSAHTHLTARIGTLSN